MSDCPHKHGYSHCTECCDESIAETERQLACAEATAQAQAYRANTSEERVGEQTKRIMQLTEALTLAKGYMRHKPECALYIPISANSKVYCDCGHTAAMERVVLALPRPTVVVECGDK